MVRDSDVRRLVAKFEAGRLNRRELMARAAALGISAPLLGGVLARSAAAQEGTPQLGNFSGRTLRISVGLQETERTVFNDVIVQGFKDLTQGDVEVINITSADVITTLAAQVSSGNIEIDLLTQDNNALAPLVDQELVEELPEAEQVMPSTTIAALKDVLKFSDKYYFLPARPNVQITYYNETELNNAGVTPPATWDELTAAAQTIKDTAGIGKVSIQAVKGPPLGVTVTQFIWQAGGDPLMINTEQAAQAFSFMQGLKDNLTPQYPTATFDTTNNYILNNSVVLAQNWPFGINIIVDQGEKEDVKVYDGWSGPAGNFLVLGGDVFGIVKGTPNRDMALDFAKYFMSQGVQEQLTAQLGWPAIRDDAFGAVVEWQAPYFEVIKTALTHVKPRPNVTYWAEVENILSDAFNDIVTNGEDPTSTLAEYQAKIDEAAAGA